MIRTLLVITYLAISSASHADDIDGVGFESCLRSAEAVALEFSTGTGTPISRSLCDEAETGFIQFRVTKIFSSGSPHTGLEQLFFQRAHSYLDALAEGREIRLSYTIEPNDKFQDIWSITVADSAGNIRSNRDYIWARNFRNLDGSAPANLLLGEPLVYFHCTTRSGLTCGAEYHIDKCYGVKGALQGQSLKTHYYLLSVAMIGEKNVERAFENFDPVNQISERILQILSPTICAFYTELE